MTPERSSTDVESYLDIKLRPDPEFSPHHLLPKLYANLHRALVDRKNSTIAVSFPGYSMEPQTLGDKLRLIASKSELQNLMETDWLKGMRDHIALQPIADVPSDAEQRALRRVQSKSSPARLRRRLIRRHNISEAEAMKRIPDNVARQLALPFLTMSSTSTGQQYRLFLQLENLSGPQPGQFNTFGLSDTATIPWF